MSTLIAKIAKAGSEVGGKLKADKRNAEQGYNYVSADKILAMCGQALFDQGIAIIPAIGNLSVNVIDRGNGKSRYDATVEFMMTVTDGETTINETWFGMGSDYSVPDKAAYKAITSGHKYFLSKLFCIGEGNEDGEHEVEEPPARPAQKPTQPPAEKPATPTPKAETPDNVIDWPAGIVTELSAKYEKHPNQIRNALKMSELMHSANPDIIRAWMHRYTENRAAGMTPQEAAAAANS